MPLKQAAAASGEGGPQELDLATTLASFPPEVRDEVLMTADEEMLAQLPPAILAEAQACVSHPRSVKPAPRSSRNAISPLHPGSLMSHAFERPKLCENAGRPRDGKLQTLDLDLEPRREF